MSRTLCLLLTVALGALGCHQSVHPRVGPGLPPPSWIEVDKPLPFDDEDSEAPAEVSPSAGPREIAARHILVMYKGSAHAPETIGRTREEALARAKECLQRLRAGEPFESLVEQYSDEPGAAKRGGDLGRFNRSRMVESFSKAAFALKPGELSDVVETQFGFHIIQRTE